MNHALTTAGVGTRRASARSPVNPLGLIDEAATARWNALAWGFVALGMLARLVRYLQCYPLWGDECMLAENFLTRDFTSLIAPLDHQQVAPLGFLWIELAMTWLAGFSEWSLRLFPLACGLASVWLMRHVAARLLSGPALAAAVAVFAVSYYPIRHAAEVKPYAVDTCMTLALLALAIEHWRAPGTTRWLWLLSLAGPMALALSFPAAFVAGGVSLALAFDMWRGGRRESILPWCCFNVAIVATFGGLFWLSESKRYDASADFMTQCWGYCFPPLDRPLGLAVWLLQAHTGETFAHPLGGQNFASTLTTLCYVAGLVAMYRAGLFIPLAMWLAPLGVALVAAALHRYPYGETSRLMQYAAPLVCLPAGVGMAALVGLMKGTAHRRHGWRALFASLAVVAACVTVEGLIHPYKHRCDYVHRAFAMWFWGQEGSRAVVSTDRDLGLGYFYPGCERSSYSCFQAIYHRPIRGDELAATEPASIAQDEGTLNCAVFMGNGEADAPRLAAWLADMDRGFDLIARDRFEVIVDDKHHAVGHYDVYRFRRRVERSETLATRPETSGAVR